jgi:hypothetical protein
MSANVAAASSIRRTRVERAQRESLLACLGEADSQPVLTDRWVLSTRFSNIAARLRAPE